MVSPLRIATRNSKLALWQANFVKAELQRRHRDLPVELVPVVCEADRKLDVTLDKIGGKGLFVKELENALLNHKADIAVHSMKDVPRDFPAGLELGVICERENPADALLSNVCNSIDELPKGAVVGTSSLRRECQLRARRPDVEIKFLRGNVNTRVDKLDAGDYDAIILAAAGLIRLGLQSRIRQTIPAEQILPAAGQGAVGIEWRSEDAQNPAIAGLLAALQHERSARCVRAERAMTALLGGSCQVPVAAYAEYEGDTLWLRGLVGRRDGSEVLRAEARGGDDKPEQLGAKVAEDLISQGAADILAEIDHG